MPACGINTGLLTLFYFENGSENVLFVTDAPLQKSQH